METQDGSAGITNHKSVWLGEGHSLEQNHVFVYPYVLQPTSHPYINISAYTNLHVRTLCSQWPRECFSVLVANDAFKSNCKYKVE